MWVTAEMIKGYLEYHFKLDLAKGFKVEPNPRRVFDPYPDFQSVTLNPPALAGGC